MKNSRRKRSTFAKFLVSIILIDEKPIQKDEINDTAFNNDIVLISEKDYFNNIEFDLGEILKEALTITQRESNMTLNFNVEEIKIVEEETKQVIINSFKNSTKIFFHSKNFFHPKKFFYPKNFFHPKKLFSSKKFFTSEIYIYINFFNQFVNKYNFRTCNLKIS